MARSSHAFGSNAHLTTIINYQCETCLMHVELVTQSIPNINSLAYSEIERVITPSE